ncbi:hybrid sensor histidine kinase/response regulator [Noviherbaspirillum galbum]|uniref:histidine kinase n=1 Tax=Noviherbaspirillum galbum TaxID=2709383 RepID=A0A6B3SG67_9BURK|nr:PAS domain S-box protein [Noviherbaspirillum galbum]NEX59610.1 PAS domain S-box protein [Noviherbaspirillum galbum]
MTTFRTGRDSPPHDDFQQIVDSARHFAIIGLDTDGRVTYWNGGARLLLGWSMDEMLGQELERIFTPEDVAAGIPRHELEQARLKGYGSDERWHLRKDGSRFWASGEVTPIRGEDGGLRGFAKIMQDRTVQKKDEMRLNASTAQLESNLVATTHERDRLWTNSLDLLLEIDAQGHIRAINPAWKRMLGYDEKDLVSRHFAPFVHPDDVERTAQAIVQASQGPLIHFEVRIRHKQGTYHDIAWTAAPEGGMIYANGRDITLEKRQAEMLNAQTRERLRLALEAGRLGVWEWDMRNDRVLLLEGAPALHGFASSETAISFSSMSQYVDLVHPDDREKLTAVIRQALDRNKREGRRPGTRDYSVEYRVQAPGGRFRWLEVRGTVHEDDEGKPCFMHGISLDMTRRKQDERDMAFLARASEELAALVDTQSTINKVAMLAVPDFADWCAIDLVQHGRLSRMAVAHVDPRKVELARDLYERFPPEPGDAHGSWQVIRSGKPMLAAHIPDDALAQSVREPERLKALQSLGLRSYIGVPLTAHGEVIGAAIFITAESGRIYSQQDMALAMELARRAAVAIENAQLYQAVQQADRDKDVFLATLAHELRNPLAALSNAVTLLGLRAPTPERLPAIQALMHRQVGQLSRLVDDLLDISRIATGKIALRREPCNLAMIINHAVEASRPQIEAGRHQLSLNYPDQPIDVFGDGARLTQVFANLLGNAAKFTPEGGRIMVDVRQDGNECEVRIADNGIGIEADMLPQIFQLFSQGRQLDDRGGGLGIGLSLVERLVHMHGGRTSAHSEGQGRGSEFVVRLPVVQRSRDAGDAAAPARKPLQESWWNGKEVLVVDDNVDAAMTLSELLRMFGATVATVNDGPAALDAIASAMPAAVLLDIGMPLMDGFEVARRIRGGYPGAGAVLVALTGWGQSHDRQAALDAGFDYHWVKPVTVQRLLEFQG